MRDIWVISDTHFGHSNIIKYCNRPFNSSKEMDEVLIHNWNAVVKPDDIVYHLGDVYFSSSSEWSGKLNGRKRLILGNHDDGKDSKIQKNFQKILVFRMYTEFGLLLSHVPVHPSSLERYVEGKLSSHLVNVHGHVHNNSLTDVDRYVNVSVEKTNYSPVNIETLRVK